MMIEIQIDNLLERLGRSFYWLSRQTGISYSTLWRLKKGKAMGINFITLEKLCDALGCEPGDLLKIGKVSRNKPRLPVENGTPSPPA